MIIKSYCSCIVTWQTHNDCLKHWDRFCLSIPKMGQFVRGCGLSLGLQIILGIVDFKSEAMCCSPAPVGSLPVACFAHKIWMALFKAWIREKVSF
jgi:hypothetical protein